LDSRFLNPNLILNRLPLCKTLFKSVRNFLTDVADRPTEDKRAAPIETQHQHGFFSMSEEKSGKTTQKYRF